MKTSLCALVALVSVGYAQSVAEQFIIDGKHEVRISVVRTCSLCADLAEFSKLRACGAQHD